jgi:hypothetical protein
MRMRTLSYLVLAIALTLGAGARAEPPNGGWHRPDREQRLQMMQKIHTGFILELGQLLALDTAGSIKLAGRLQPFDDQRIQVRLGIGDAMDQLKQAAKQGGGGSDMAALARQVGQARVQLAQIDLQELEEILKGLPPDKVAKVAVFMAEYPRRVEHLAHEIHQSMHPHGPGEHED